MANVEAGQRAVEVECGNPSFRGDVLDVYCGNRAPSPLELPEIFPVRVLGGVGNSDGAESDVSAFERE